MTIVITTILFIVLVQVHSHGVRPKRGLVLLLLPPTATIAASTLLKIPAGGWLTVGIGLGLYLLMSTWWPGRRRLRAAVRRDEERSALDLYGELIGPDSVVRRLPGAACSSLRTTQSRLPRSG